MNVKKIKLIGIVSLLVLFTMSAITLVIIVGNRNMHRINAEERAHFMNLLWKIDYADGLHFHFQIYRYGERILTGGSRAFAAIHQDSVEYPLFTDVVLVYNEEEGQRFMENVIVAWPATEENWTESRIEQMHREVNHTEEEIMSWPLRMQRPVITLEEFGLSYPITRVDLVNNWEKVAALRVALGLFHAAE